MLKSGGGKAQLVIVYAYMVMALEKKDISPMGKRLVKIRANNGQKL